MQVNTRIPWIDFLRGIAIMLMVPANYSPLLAEPHPLWLRMMGSYAAPIFILLSTGMVILNKNKEKHDLDYYLLRGSIIIFFGVLMDLLNWGIFPFVSYDILYLIGLALPVVYVVRHCRISQLISLGLIFFIFAWILQKGAGYHSAILEVYLDHPYWPGIMRLFLSGLVDGWFPIFPWLGYAFFGAAFFKIIFLNSNQLVSKKMLFLAMLTATICFIFLFLPGNGIANVSNGGILESRIGYSEIFYPPTLFYLFSSLSVFLILAYAAQHLYQYKLSSVICLFGRHSMLIYILHLIIDAHILSPLIALNGEETISRISTYIAMIFITMTALYFICKFIDYLKKFYTPSSLIFQVLLGK